MADSIGKSETGVRVDSKIPKENYAEQNRINTYRILAKYRKRNMLMFSGLLASVCGICILFWTCNVRLNVWCKILTLTNNNWHGGCKIWDYTVLNNVYIGFSTLPNLSWFKSKRCKVWWSLSIAIMNYGKCIRTTLLRCRKA